MKFDLDKVPSDRQVNSEIYIAITNIRGDEINAVAGQEALIKGVAQDLKIKAVDAKKVKLTRTQSIDMAFSPNEKTS